MRTPLALYVLALAVRAVLIATYPDPAYPDSYYYVDVARALAATGRLEVDFVWIFAEVGNRIPAEPTLPVPANAHWLPLASFVQLPFIAMLGPTAIASALPSAFIGALAAPLTWLIARDVGARPSVALGAGVLAAVPAAGTVFMAQPENFALLQVLVPATLWLVALGLKGNARAFALSGLLVGLASLARNDGVLLGGAVGLIWLADRFRAWRAPGTGRPPIPLAAAVGCLALFLLVMGPWWARQLAVFGSISPTSSTGVALWIRDISEWNSITADPSLSKFLAQGPAAIVGSRLAGLASAIGNFAVIICSVVLLPFLLVGAVARRRSVDFLPWLVYAVVVFAGAALLYPLHVPGGAFIHSAVGLEPHAYILALEGVLAVVGWIARRRRTWRETVAGPVFLWSIVGLTVATTPLYAVVVQATWAETREPRVALAAELDRMGVSLDERLLSIDAAGFKYWTGRPGVVTPNDPIDVIEAVARAYDVRWLVLERSDIVGALIPVLEGREHPDWVGPASFVVASADGGTPTIALHPVCLTDGDPRCTPTVGVAR